MEQIDICIIRHPEAIESEWRALERDCLGHVFQSYDWVSVWLSTAGKHQDIEPLIIVCRDSSTSELLAIWPLAVKRYLGFLKVAGKLGDIHADYGGPLLSKAAMVRSGFGERFRPALLSALKSLRIDALTIGNVPADVCHFLKLTGNNADIEDDYSTWFRVAGRRDDYFSAINKKVLADTRRQERRLSAIGKLNYVVAENCTDAIRITGEMIEQKSNRYKQTGVLDQFRHQYNRDFYLELASRLSGLAGPIHVSALVLDEKVIAAHWGAIFGGRYYYLMPSYQAGELSRYSPGKILLEHVIGTSFQIGVTEFDFTIGNEGYKEIWGSERSNLVSIRRALSLPGLCAISLIHFGQKARAFLKQSELARSVKKRLFRLISASKT